MAVVEKKIWPDSFEMMLSGKKNFDVRLADFDVKEGDIIRLREWNPRTNEYTGRELNKRVSFIQSFKIDDHGQEKEIQEKGVNVIQFEGGEK